MKNLIHEFSDVFAYGEDDLGRCLHATHKVDTGHHPPMNGPPYRVHVQRLSPYHTQDFLPVCFCGYRPVVAVPDEEPASPPVTADLPTAGLSTTKIGRVVDTGCWAIRGTFAVVKH